MRRRMSAAVALLGFTAACVAACSVRERPAPASSIITSAALGLYGTEPVPGGTLDPVSIPKYETALVIPPAMPSSSKSKGDGPNNIDYYDIAVREFSQYILPDALGKTTRVWSYGSVAHPGTVAEGGTFNYPALTIEARVNRPVRVIWRNELVKDPVACFHSEKQPEPGACDYLPHLLAIDETLHWANPRGECRDGISRPDCQGVRQTPYLGPVPVVTHLHGSNAPEESDGYAEAWYLPDAGDIPADIKFSVGTFYDHFKAIFEARWGQGPRSAWTPGTAVFQYPNDTRAATLWYHDHTLGMTRANVYAGPAGFYILRGGKTDKVKDKNGGKATLPGPAPSRDDPPGLTYREIPIAIQDRSFNDDGSLFYPRNREFFEGLEEGALARLGVGFDSDVAPIWNPEFFGNTMVVNGKTWPYLDVEPKQYRLRLLNGCNSRFLILRLVKATDPADPSTWTPAPGLITQIGTEAGFLPAPIRIDSLLMGPAERVDVIVDFSQVSLASGEGLYLMNFGPDEPFGGGTPGVDFPLAHPGTTGQVMKFQLVAATSDDDSTKATDLVLPARTPLPGADNVRRLTLNEQDSATETLCLDEGGNPISTAERPCPEGTTEVPFGPASARLGVLNADGTPAAMSWDAPITETPRKGDTELWELYNFTADAHPIHIHELLFEVVDRQLLATGDDGMPVQPVVLQPDVLAPEPWETGLKDTVIAYPGQVTRVKARFERPGLFVWHCHIVEHEDNEMMRPYCITHEDGSMPASCIKAGTSAHPHD